MVLDLTQGTFTAEEIGMKDKKKLGPQFRHNLLENKTKQKVAATHGN